MSTIKSVGTWKWLSNGFPLKNVFLTSPCLTFSINCYKHFLSSTLTIFLKNALGTGYTDQKKEMTFPQNLKVRAVCHLGVSPQEGCFINDHLSLTRP